MPSSPQETPTVTQASQAAAAAMASGGADGPPQAADATEPSAELAELVGRTMRRIHGRTREALAPLGLSGSQARVVRLLGGGPLRMAAIAERLAVVPRTVTDIVDGAEAAGAVARRPDPQDRRSTLVELTPAGRLLLIRVEAIRRESASLVFGTLSEPERTELLALLRAVCESEGCDDVVQPAAGPTRAGGAA